MEVGVIRGLVRFVSGMCSMLCRGRGRGGRSSLWGEFSLLLHYCCFFEMRGEADVGVVGRRV